MIYSSNIIGTKNNSGISFYKHKSCTNLKKQCTNEEQFFKVTCSPNKIYKKVKVEENDNDDESDSFLLKRKITQSTIKINNRKRTNTNIHFSAQKTLIPYSNLNLKNNN